MAARAISSATISFGLVSIPIKLFTSAASEQVRFNMLHDKCGGRLKQQMICPTDDEVVDRTHTVKGYEYARGQYVLFSEEELKKLEADRSNSIEIIEFVPLASVDFVQVEKSYYLGPDKGGDRAYRLLGEAMRDKGRVAVGRYAARGKEQLVLVRPYGKDGLILHQLYYATEVRNFEEVPTGATFQFSDVERGLAEQLIDQLSADAFQPEKYHDVYADRVQAAVEQKVAGQEITIAPEQPKAQIIDLFEALKKSLAQAPPETASAKPVNRAAADESVQAKPLKKAAAKKSRNKASTG
jgi:DNA end-binding protein Ku